MSDFFREVDEEYRQERALAILRQYAPALIAIVAAVSIGVFAWRYTQTQSENAAVAANLQFSDAQNLAKEDKMQEAVQAFEAIKNSGAKGYAQLAQLAAADALAQTDAPAAVKAYDALAATPTQQDIFKLVAQWRAALLRSDDADREEMERRLQPLAAGGAAFRSSARELLALTALKAGDTEAATDWLTQIVSDAEAPQQIHAVAQEILDMMRADQPAKK